jgi:hypothetical protein
VPFVLLVVLFAVGSHLAGPLLQQLRGRSEWAEYAGRVMDAVGILSQKNEDEPEESASAARTDSSAAGRSKRRPGVSDSAAVPRDLPRHPRASETLYNVGPDHVLIYQRVAGTRDAAIARLREAMAQQGWKAASENPGDWSTLIRWTKGNRSCMVEFADDGGSTEIWIRSKVPPNP